MYYKLQLALCSVCSFECDPLQPFRGCVRNSLTLRVVIRIDSVFQIVSQLSQTLCASQGTRRGGMGGVVVFGFCLSAEADFDRALGINLGCRVLGCDYISVTC